MSKISVLLVDDHDILRKGIKAILEKESDITVVGEASDGIDAVKQAEAKKPDLVLMDISMPLLNGLQATIRIKHALPDTKIIILSRHRTREYVYKALKAGASGYLIKKSAFTDLISAIQAVCQNKRYLSPDVSELLIDGFLGSHKSVGDLSAGDELTDREQEILQLIAEGMSTNDIANHLHISLNTVATHRTHIMNKLDIHTTAKLIRYAIENGIIE
ncbi:MAG: response regulator transcription factor [Candidatus Marinimicrobia bacterium]|nr:response regulator transcription factor [Candidatus Neomarinimicrobiota bacterium]